MYCSRIAPRVEPNEKPGIFFIWPNMYHSSTAWASCGFLGRPAELMLFSNRKGVEGLGRMSNTKMAPPNCECQEAQDLEDKIEDNPESFEAAASKKKKKKKKKKKG